MRNIVTRLALAALLLTSSAALAHAETTGATQFMEARQTAVNSVLNKKGKPDAEALGREIDTLLDYEGLSRSALRDHWDARTPTERSEFVGLLKQLVERSYKKNLRSTLGYDIRYLGEDTDELGTVVKTRAKSTTHKREPAITIDYTLHKVDGQWRVIDITTDGVSMVRNYRSQFNRILRKDGWADLIQRMQDRLENESESGV